MGNAFKLLSVGVGKKDKGMVMEVKDEKEREEMPSDNQEVSEEEDDSCAFEDPSQSNQAMSLGEQGLSKNALKRAKRKLMFQELKKAKKEKKKQEKAEKRERSQSAANNDSSVIDQRSARPSSSPSTTTADDLTHRKRVKKEVFETACQSNFHVIIDCDWENEHSDSSLTSLTQQIMFCYGSNRRAEKPVHLHLSGLGPRATANLQRVKFENWAGVSYSAHDYIEQPGYSVLPEEGKKQLVYLTSDAEETLETLDPNCAYIIGGIVDRNRLKGATYGKAVSQNVRTARLPIQKYFALKATHVLAVNHVFDILLAFASNPDWTSALEKILPKRKEAARLGDDVDETKPDDKISPRLQQEEEEDEEEKKETEGDKLSHVSLENSCCGHDKSAADFSSP